MEVALLVLGIKSRLDLLRALSSPLCLSGYYGLIKSQSLQSLVAIWWIVLELKPFEVALVGRISPSIQVPIGLAIVFRF